jgi:hypothetical protein
MRQVMRPRRYVSRHLLLLLRPIFRFSASRRAYVLRLVGNKAGPVLRLDRRTAHQRPADGVDRRGRASTI